MTQDILINSSVAHYITEKNLERWLRIYDKQGDNLVDEKKLVNITFLDLSNYFKPLPEDPLMFDCYQVYTPEQVNFLEQVLFINFDVNSFDYFIECNSL